MAVLAALDRLQGVFISNLCGFLGHSSSFPFRSKEQHLLLFLLFLESPELHGVVWGCFSRLQREIVTNVMISILCPSLEGSRNLCCCAGHGCPGCHWDGIGKLQRQEFLYRWHIFFPKLQQKEPWIFIEDICGVCNDAACGFFPHSPISVFSGSGIAMGF